MGLLKSARDKYYVIFAKMRFYAEAGMHHKNKVYNDLYLEIKRIIYVEAPGDFPFKEAGLMGFNLLGDYHKLRHKNGSWGKGRWNTNLHCWEWILIGDKIVHWTQRYEAYAKLRESE